MYMTCLPCYSRHASLTIVGATITLPVLGPGLAGGLPQKKGTIPSTTYIVSEECGRLNTTSKSACYNIQVMWIQFTRITLRREPGKSVQLFEVPATYAPQRCRQRKRKDDAAENALDE